MTLHPRIHIIRIFLITLVISLVSHLLLIFYLPPIDQIDILSLKNNIKSKPQPLQINIQGNLENGKSEGEQEDQNSNFSDKFGVDKNKWAELLSKLEENTGLSKSFKQVYEDISPKFNVKKSYIYRPRNHEDIVVKDVFPTIRNIEKPFSEILNAAKKDLKDHNERNKIIKDYRDWKLRKNNDSRLIINLVDTEDNESSSPLDFPKEKRDKYFDQNLSLPKGLQLTNFIRQYFSHDPNVGDLPIATRELYYKNLQRLAYSFSSDPSYLYLDYFLENLNKEEFLKNALYQAAEKDSTKTQTELLFALEDIYHIQQRAWRYYFDYEKIYKNIPAEKRKHLRVETLKRVVAGYKNILQQKNIKSYKDIEELYRKKRLEILEYLVSHTPEAYRQPDALFEIAFIYWQQGILENKPELKRRAVKQWLTIPFDKTPDVNNIDHISQITLQKLNPLLTSYISSKAPQTQIVQQQIQRIITNRHSDRINKKRLREEQLLWK